MNSQPKGGMCKACILRYQDCSKLDFSGMPVIQKDKEVRIVKCSNFARKTSDLYVVWSIDRERYWGPNSFGYTEDSKKAQVYSLSEAQKIVEDANINGIHEKYIQIKDL